MKQKASVGRKIARVVGRGTTVVASVLGCLLEYGVRGTLGRLDPAMRATVLQRWSARMLAALHITTSVESLVPETGLIVSNHLSYLDILVFSAITRCVFVSKREVKAWLGVGWAASLAGTVFIDRTRRSETHAVLPEMQAALSRGVPVVLFPEGTTSDGSTVLHFHSSLFQPALDLNAEITAAAVQYSFPQGEPEKDACYWGEMTLLPHLLKLMTKSSVEAKVSFSSEHLHFSDRKEAARTMLAKVETLRGAAKYVASLK